MAETFASWLDGAPVSGSRTTFGFWLDGALVLSEAITVEVSVVFTGNVTKPRVRGKKLLATLVPGGVAFDQQVPRFVLGASCNHAIGPNPDGSYLMSYGCGLLKADWKFTAAVTTPIASAYPFELNVDGLARDVGATPTYFADWFANAVIEVGTGANIQRRRILSSTLPAAGAMTVTVDRWFTTTPADNDPVVIYPQCDGRLETCKAYHASTNPTGKFNNDDAFGGHPFIPHGNPSGHDATDLTAGGGKK